MIYLPFTDIYPNPIQEVSGTPAIVFRDHRWTLPALYFAFEAGRLKLPARVVTFDRHRDSLVPRENLADFWRFPPCESAEGLVRTIADRISPRDDDWIIAGMELGLISEVVQFRTEPDDLGEITCHVDRNGTGHRIFHRERPSVELTWKGALTDSSHSAVSAGLWEVLGWNPAEMRVTASEDLALDIDLDFFTISWETHVFPFPGEVYEKEFLEPRASGISSGYRPADFLWNLVGASRVLTMACEPDFCGGAEKSRRILEDMNRYLLRGSLDTAKLLVDYPPRYPVE